MDDVLLQDLVEYKTNRDRGVSMAARSLLQLFRVIHPALLKKKDRVLVLLCFAVVALFLL